MDGYVRIGTKLDTKSFDAQIEYVESQLNDIEDKLKKADMGLEVGDTQKLESQYEKLTSQLGKLRAKQLEANKTDFSGIKKSIDGVSDKIGGTIKKLGRWVLAVFAIESAYGAVRRAMSTLSNFNDQIKTDLDYIQFALASAMQPLVESLIQLAYKLLTYVNFIAQAWFGVNLFANSSTDAFASANKQAEKLKKTTAGFDEMNILSDTSSSNTSATPSFDLASPENVPIPSWLQWLLDNGSVIVAIIAGITGGLIALKLGMMGIQALGIGLIITGILLLIKSFLAYLNDPSWENFGKIITAIGVTLLGLGAILGSIPVLITAVILLITGIIVSNWDFIKGILQGAINFIIEKLSFLKKLFGDFGTAMIEIIVAPIRMVLALFDGLFKGIKQIFDGIIQIAKGNFAGGLTSIFIGLGNVIIGVMNTLINGLNATLSPFRALIVAFGKITGKGWTMENIKIPTMKYLATGGIVNYPNKGVSVGSAMAGESGAEGVIPLTDSQAMETLGSAIGRYITINATIENKMNGRLLNRELQKINSSSSFATNR